MRANTIVNPEVAEVFRAYPKPLATRLMALRRLIFDVAARTEGVGALQETLKWGQPSYVTAQTKSGSTIRIDRVKGFEDRYAMFFHCQTMLVDTFRGMYGDLFRFEGNRSITFDANDRVPQTELANCVAMALTYHLSKKRVATRRGTK